MRGFYLIISFFEKRNIRFDKRLYDTAAAKAADKAKAYKTLYCGDIGDAGISSAALVSRGPTEIFCLTELFII